MKKKDGKNRNYVLDSTAFLTMFEDEPGADTAQGLLEEASTGKILVFISFVTFTEIFYITLREKGTEEAQKRMTLMDAIATTRIESSKELSLIAGRLKAAYR